MSALGAADDRHRRAVGLSVRRNSYRARRSYRVATPTPRVGETGEVYERWLVGAGYLDVAAAVAEVQAMPVPPGGGPGPGGGAAPPPGCVDRLRPRARLRAARLRGRGRRIRISGAASDRGCGAAGTGAVRRVRLAVAAARVAADAGSRTAADGWASCVRVAGASTWRQVARRAGASRSAACRPAPTSCGHEPRTPQATQACSKDPGTCGCAGDDHVRPAVPRNRATSRPTGAFSPPRSTTARSRSRCARARGGRASCARR